MRRGFEIRVAFSATRLSAEHLRAAYEVVTPMIERIVAMEDNATVARQRDEEGLRRRRRGTR
jgi:hypothetical protein